MSNIEMQKYLFLFTKEYERVPSYDFIPYRFGCFSFQSYADRRKLIEFGVLANRDGWNLVEDDEALDPDVEAKAAQLVKKYGGYRGDELVKLVYQKYPYYAIRSEISERLMDQNDRLKIESQKPSDNTPMFFTIGYEGQSFEHYINRLITNNVKLLCDVRKNPLSRKYGFSKKTLSETVEKMGIAYLHIPELGIVSDKRSHLETKEDYNKLFAEYENTTLRSELNALDRLANLVSEYGRVAITCFEAEHCMCHRSMVSKNLAQRSDWQYEIAHI